MYPTASTGRPVYHSYAWRYAYWGGRTLRQIREDFWKCLEEHRPKEPRFLVKNPPQTAKVIPRKWGPKAREQRDRRTR